MKYSDVQKLKDTPLIPAQVYNNLPLYLKNICSNFTDARERDLFLISTLGVISGCLPNVTFLHGGKRYFTNLCVFIVAPAASGKGRMSNSRKLAEGIHTDKLNENKKRMDQYLIDLAEWSTLDKTEKITTPKPQEPKLEYLFLPGNCSAAAVIELLNNTDGKGVMFESEADTVSNAIGQEWGAFSDQIRKNAENEPISQSRKGSNNYVEIKSPKFSIVLSGTPQQVTRLIPSVEDGLFSRFIFYSFKKEILWNDIFSSNQIDIEEILKEDTKRLKSIYEMCLVYDRIEFTWKKEHQIQLDKLFRYWTTFFSACFSEECVSTIYRSGVTITRIAAILSVIENTQKGGIDQKIICSDTAFQASTELMHILLYHSFYMYSSLPNSISQMDPTLARLLDIIPSDDFIELQKVKDLARESGILYEDRSMRYKLTELIKEGFVEKAKKGFYKRVEKRSSNKLPSLPILPILPKSKINGSNDKIGSNDISNFLINNL